jgi:hypothetical protein
MAQIDLANLAARIRAVYPRELVEAVLASPPPVQFHKYRNDPVGFIREVLGVTLTADQKEIAEAAKRGGRIKVNSGHGIGKSFVAACLALWWFYTRDAAVIVTTAPTERDVIFILWTEIRLLHRKSKVPLPEFFIGPRAPEMFDNEEHWAKGYTANKGEAFQGRHRESMLFIFDEAEGLDPVYWDTTTTMFQKDMDHLWVAIGNPTTTSSQSYLEDLAVDLNGEPKWKIYTLSALNHPNVIAQLNGLPPPVPNAVTLGQVEDWFGQWCTLVPKEDRKPTDIEWPPIQACKTCKGQPGDWKFNSELQGACPECLGVGLIGGGRIYRPGPSFQSRVMGLRPGAGVDTVWSMDVWNLAVNPRIPSIDRLRAAWGGRSGVAIGVDPAAVGDDDTAMHVRIGPVSVHHESHNGWGPDESAGRLKELSREWSSFYNALAIGDRPQLEPEDVRVTIEGDGGFGVGVYSHRGNFRRWGLANAGSSATMISNGKPIYANCRAQWWCESAKVAAAGGMDLSRLPADVLNRLRIQLLAPYYWLLPGGARAVEPKKDVKGRLKRSPDDADSLILSHYEVKSFMPSVIGASDEE